MRGRAVFSRQPSGKRSISSRTFRSFESYIVVTLVYLMLAVLLRQFLVWIGPRFIFGRRRA